jgi:L-threonylcarbamoyladenylate synthase
VSETFRLDPDHPEGVRRALDAAAGALAAGDLVVVPTETVYGLCCRPDLATATERMFEAKHRPAQLNLPVLAAVSASAWELAEPDRRATALARACWPGPLTLILPRTDRSRGWALGEKADSIGVRVPDHRIAVGLLRRTGQLAATSANLSGQPPAEYGDDAVGTFGPAVAVYLLLRPGWSEPSGQSSTVLDLTEPDLRLVREGAIGRAEIDAVLARSGPPAAG